MNIKSGLFSLKSLASVSLGTLFLFAGLETVSLAAKERLLGQTRISFGTDFDYLPINSNCSKPSISAIKIRVLKAPVEIEKISIKYGNNKLGDLPVRSKFAKDSESKWVDLKGDRRCIKALAVWGKTKNQASQQALIQFYSR